MKANILTLAILIANFILAFPKNTPASATDPARIYVKANASGANDGSSWANAFTRLNNALSSAQQGDEIWVAAGTYLPDVPNGGRSATFLIDKNIRLYGGFAGTESTLGDRGNPSSRPTILSGDLMGNDPDDNNPLNRRENVMTVLTIGPNITQKTIIDGFTITGGQADGTTGHITGPAKCGGGLYAMGYPVLRNCIFTKNHAGQRGGGAYFKSASSPLIEQCQFLDNTCGDWGGGLFIDPASGPVEIKSSLFRNNTALRGGGAASLNQDTRLTSCIFLSNTAAQHGGGFLFLAMEKDGITVRAENCVFRENSASLGGGLYMFAYVARKDIRFQMFHCGFLGNKSIASAPGWGPAGGGGLFSIASQNSSATVKGCTFSQNSSARYAGGFGAMLYGTHVRLEIKGSEFLENTSETESGALGVWGLDDGTGSARLDGCLFENNKSGMGGAVGMGNGFEGSPGNFGFDLSNCTWKGNQATLGGALRIWSDPESTTQFKIKDCLLENNVASFSGGAIYLGGGGYDFLASVSHTILRNNHSPISSAIDISSFSYAGTIYPRNAQFMMDNCLVAGNTGEHPAISARYGLHLCVSSSTIAGNQGGGFQLSHESNLMLQNSILYNPGFPEYEERMGGSSFISMGGNLIGDLSLDGQLTAADKQNFDPQFSETGDYHLASTSPCIDAGNENSLPAALDLGGQPRIQGLRVDMGAFESPFITALRETLAGEAMVAPNPASSYLRILLPENTGDEFDIEVFDMAGKLALSQPLGKRETLDVNRLPAAMYSLRVTAGGRVFTGRFIKQ